MAVEFGSINLEDFGFRLIEIEEDLLPQVRNTTIPALSGEGSIIMSRGLEAGQIKLLGRIIAPNKTELESKKRSLAAALINEEIVNLQDQELRLPDRNYFYYASIDRYTPLSPILSSADIELNFRCADPFKYLEQKSRTSPALATEITINNEGEYPCFPTITVGLYPRQYEQSWVSEVKNLSLSKNNTVKYTYTTGQTETIVATIDNAKETITHGGQTAELRIFLETDFFPLIPGENIIYCASRNPNQPEPERYFTVRYRERFL